jgi:hypothetical protein
MVGNRQLMQAISNSTVRVSYPFLVLPTSLHMQGLYILELDDFDDSFIESCNKADVG